MKLRIRNRNSLKRGMLTGLILVTAAILQLSAQEIAYDSNVNGSHDIWVINSDGSGKLNLSSMIHDPNGQFTEYEPKWSPDGARLVYLSNKSGVPNVWIMDASGSNDYNLTGSSFAEYQPKWSPDGKTIYFARNKNYSSPSGCAPCPHWEIFSHNLETGIECQLTFNSSREMNPIPSPDGRYLVYARAERENDCCNATDVWIMSSDGTNQRLLFGWSNGKYEWPFHWGRVNNTLLVAAQSGCGYARCYEVMLVNPDNSNHIRVTDNNFEDVPQAFSPEEDKILVRSKKSGSTDLWIMAMNGAYLLNLTRDSAREISGDWRPSAPVLEASVNIDPDTLEKNSRGRWVTCYIDLPEGYDVNEIDIDTVALEYDSQILEAERGAVQKSVFMVKFSRPVLINMLGTANGYLELTVTGQAAGKTFAGADTIRVK